VSLARAALLTEVIPIAGTVTGRGVEMSGSLVGDEIDFNSIRILDMIKSPTGSVFAGVGFQFGVMAFVQDADYERAAAVIAVVNVKVHAVSVPYPPPSLAMPWNGGLAIDLRQTVENCLETLRCFGMWGCRI
jgi:hypothetical protein